MGDIDPDKLTMPVRVRGGGDSSEEYPADVTPNEDLRTNDVCRTTATSKIILVGRTQTVQLKCNAVALPTRKIIEFQPIDGEVYWSYKSNMTEGFKAFQFQYHVKAIEGDTIKVYFKKVSGWGFTKVAISELA